MHAWNQLGKAWGKYSAVVLAFHLDRRDVAGRVEVDDDEILRLVVADREVERSTLIVLARIETNASQVGRGDQCIEVDCVLRLPEDPQDCFVAQLVEVVFEAQRNGGLWIVDVVR